MTSTPRKPPARVAPRSPGLAVLLSVLVPGLGTAVAGMPVTGAVIFACYAAAWLLAVSAGVALLFVLIPAAWIWGLIDAHRTAVRWNADHGIIS